MSLPYSLTKTQQGYYIFTTDEKAEYTAFFTRCLIDDKEGNTHQVYSFGFERNGGYNSEKFTSKHDPKIKATIIFIVNEFFRSNGSNILIYFCFLEDNLARQRSITFSKWYNESLSTYIEHHKTISVYNENTMYIGALMLRDNPLRELAFEAIDKYVRDSVLDKES